MAKRIFVNGQTLHFKMTQGADLETLPEGQELPEPTEVITLTEPVTLYRRYWAVYDDNKELLYLQEKGE